MSTGKIAIVTGASSGIGKSIAEQLAAAGVDVAVTYSGNPQGAEATVAAIKAKGRKAVAIQADFSTDVVATAQRVFDEAEKALGKVDILVNNHGAYGGEAFGSATEALFDTLFTINTKSVYFLLDQAAKRLADGGSVVNISSIVSSNPLPLHQAYAASKASVEVFTKVAAKEFGARNINVNAVLPGFTETRLLPEDASFRVMAAEASAFKRTGTADEVASVAVFLTSPQGHWVTGESIKASGGA
eukprot:TRINITY_DN24825_c0_g1_i1.p2 TRINITY_DN24825_c0_g1~~TRINITY_DN24825_c0_g1_i1.p2  ORF type:complete len:244 (+),score=97.14 TRINITY_DN24825_c0_g1_i1:227-958(+)